MPRQRSPWWGLGPEQEPFWKEALVCFGVALFTGALVAIAGASLLLGAMWASSKLLH